MLIANVVLGPNLDGLLKSFEGHTHRPQFFVEFSVRPNGSRPKDRPVVFKVSVSFLEHVLGSPGKIHVRGDVEESGMRGDFPFQHFDIAAYDLARKEGRGMFVEVGETLG